MWVTSREGASLLRPWHPDCHRGGLVQPGTVMEQAGECMGVCW